MTSTEFPSICSLLVHSEILLRKYVITLCWALSRNTKTNKNLEVHDILSKKESCHSSGPIPMFLLRKLRPREAKCSTSGGQSADHCPSQGRVLFLSCGALGPKLHMGLSGDGLDSPLRVASPAEPESMIGPYRDCVVSTVGSWGCRGDRALLCGP